VSYTTLLSCVQIVTCGIHMLLSTTKSYGRKTAAVIVVVAVVVVVVQK